MNWRNFLLILRATLVGGGISLVISMTSWIVFTKWRYGWDIPFSIDLMRETGLSWRGIDDVSVGGAPAFQDLLPSVAENLRRAWEILSSISLTAGALYWLKAVVGSWRGK